MRSPKPAVFRASVVLQVFPTDSVANGTSKKKRQTKTISVGSIEADRFVSYWKDGMLLYLK